MCRINLRESCVRNVIITKQLLKSLGFLINEEKSMNIPSTQCKFLGLIINSSQMTLELTQEKRKKLSSLIEDFLHKKSCKIRDFASLIGLLIAACPAVSYGLLYTKLIERNKFMALIIQDQDFEKTMSISISSKLDLNWWKRNIPIARQPIRQLKFEKEIFSDASLTGWGLVVTLHIPMGFGQHQKENNILIISS